ncbi:hypothetical protein MFFC18_03720 [Mariniblastus fucicola]|uniref:Uncharacterized protein n=1 Tax=Mariniblastus fucicola TaxID=980251 RepID=A0A5B9PBL2_9BACT|nr:hypothetical protein MFFC18_03720 [Mariniblastus fucicola]
MSQIVRRFRRTRVSKLTKLILAMRKRVLTLAAAFSISLRFEYKLIERP